MLGLTFDQAVVFGALAVALVLFIDGRIRHDIVALIALFITTVTGVVPWDQAFLGFANKAVIVVAAVLVITRGLLNSGLVERILFRLAGVGDRPRLQILTLGGLVTALSAVMSNIGALALMMPVGIGMARRCGRSPSPLLLSLAFCSLLGGLITQIGTPPNIIIASFRAEHAPGPFTLFDFTPVGLGVALAGLLFIAAIGWRLVPRRPGQADPGDRFRLDGYLAEIRVPPGSPFDGRSLADVAEIAPTVVLAGLVPANSGPVVTDPDRVVGGGDLLLVRGDAPALQQFTREGNLEMMSGCVEQGAGPECALCEAVVPAASPIAGCTVPVAGLEMKTGVDLVAVARPGVTPMVRLSEVVIEPSDVLLLAGAPPALRETIRTLGLLPLADRKLRPASGRRLNLAIGLFGLAIAITALGLVPVEGAFAMAAAAMVLFSIVPIREVYNSIDWPVVVLLAALIPVGQALETTGGAGLIAGALLGLEGELPVIALVATMLVASMLVTNVINNAAAAILMAPIAIGLAAGLEASIDTFLMAVAIGASTPFLTPIGHQSNALILEPSGLQFGDYWRLGLPLSLVVLAVATPLIILFWPP